MSDILTYKDYAGTVEYSAADSCLFGKVVGIRSLISYEGLSLNELKADFQAAVDDYLADCQSNKISPEKAYKGTFNVRIRPELHQKASIYAITHGKTLNSLVEEAIQNQVEQM